MQGDQGGCEPDRNQQASETDPSASAASQGDHQAADHRYQQADFCNSPRGRVVDVVASIEAPRRSRRPLLAHPNPR